MRQHLAVAIIGGGQAGLAMSRLLTELGIEHVVLDRGRVGDTWRKRWDSFCLVTPNWQLRLPGFPYDGREPDAFSSRDEVVDYLERYARSFRPPLRAAMVRSVEPDDRRFRVTLSEGEILADQVVVATGTHQRPKVPAFASALAPSVTQLHTSMYKNPRDLPPGGVLVVGSGQSGAQIAIDLHRAGRAVHLSVSRAGRLPRRYRGKDLLWWFDRAGLYDVPVDLHEDGRAVRRKTHSHVSGRDGGQTIDLRELAEQGVTLHGKVEAIEGTRVGFSDDLAQNLDAADAAAGRYVRTVDELVARSGIAARGGASCSAPRSPRTSCGSSWSRAPPRGRSTRSTRPRSPPPSCSRCTRRVNTTRSWLRTRRSLSRARPSDLHALRDALRSAGSVTHGYGEKAP